MTAINVSGAFWYQTYHGKFTDSKFVELLKEFMKYKKRKILLILDGHPTHTAKEVNDYISRLEG